MHNFSTFFRLLPFTYPAVRCRLWVFEEWSADIYLDSLWKHEVFRFIWFVYQPTNQLQNRYLSKFICIIVWILNFFLSAASGCGRKQLSKI